MMPGAEPSGYSAYLPEVGLHDADFFLDAQSLGAAALASWLLPRVAPPEVFERPTFRVFFISGCDHFALQGVPCCSLPCVPMFLLCGIMRFLVSKPHDAMEESLVIPHSNGHTGLSVFHVCFKLCMLRDKSFGRSSKEGRVASAPASSFLHVLVPDAVVLI